MLTRLDGEWFDGDQEAENRAYEENARYDYVAELRREHDDSRFGLDADYEEPVQGELDIRIHWEDGRMVTNAPRPYISYEADGDIPF